MADKKELEISISPDGEVTVRVRCIKGQACVEETKFLERALGGEVVSRELTEEYYEQPTEGGVTRKQGG